MKRLTDPIDYTPIPKEYVFFRENDELRAKINSLALEQNGNQGSATGDLISYATKAELSQYRKLNDISYHNHQELLIINKEVLLDNGDEQWRFTTSHIPYH